MDKNHLIGAVVGIILGVLGAVGVVDSSAVKSSICGTEPAAQVK